jgi:hypothetical protein
VLIGTGHLLFVDRTGPPPDADAVGNAVRATIGGVA